MRARLLAAFLAVVFAIIAVQDLPLVSYLRAAEHERVLVTLERDAWLLATRAERPSAGQDFAALHTIASTYGADTGSRVEIVDATGTVIASTSRDQLGYDYSNRPEITSALAGTAVTGQRDSVALGGSMLYVAVPMHAADLVTGALRISFPVASLEAIIDSRINRLIYSGIVTLSIAIAAAIALAAVIARRIRRIHAATEQLATGDLTSRVEEIPGGAPELRGLEQSFNRMATRLQSLVEAQRAFASDASHQLRTPLTALRLRLENAQHDADDPAATRRALDAAAVDVQRLQTLVDGMLAMARLEGRTSTLEVIDVTPVLAERRDLWEPLAAERGIRLEIRVPAGLSVQAVPGALEQILDTYLDNALEYAPDDSLLLITAEVTDGVTFHVIDSGPGLDETQRQRAFDRFWRGSADGNGTGLGLAIAARLAEISNADVSLHPAHPDGTGIDARAHFAKGR